MTATPDSTAHLQTATEQLRDRSRQRAVEIADNVMSNALRASRPALPVRAAAPYGYIWISDQVIIALLRQHIDAALANAAVGRIHLRVDRGETVRELTIELIVQYGQVLLVVADHARAIARNVLTALLAIPDEVAIEAIANPVHISDITIGDPQLVDPADETNP